MTSANSIIIHSNIGDQYPHTLKARYEGIRLYDPDYALSKDPAAYEKMLRDPIIRQALQIRYRAAAGGTWTVSPPVQDDNDDGPSDEDTLAAKVMQGCIGQIKKFQNARVHLATAIFRGATYGTIEGRRIVKRFGDGKEREWWVPTLVAHKDKRMVRHVPHADDFGFDLEVFTRSGSWVPLDPAECIRVVYDDDEGRLGHGRGLAESVYFFFYAKLRALEHGLQGMERWAQGMVVGKTNSQAIGDTSQTSASSASAMLEKLKTFRTNHNLVIDKEEEVEIHEPSGQGHQMVIDFIGYCDDAITRVITGSKLPAGGGGEVGSMARAETEMTVTESIVQVDSEILDEAITTHLVELCWELNREPLTELGLIDAEVPEFKSANEQVEDTEKNATVARIVLESGAPLIKSEYYEKVGFTQPGDADDVIAPVAPVQSSDPFGFPAFDGSDPVTGTPAPDQLDDDGQVVASGEELNAEGIEPPTMQELSLAYERAIKSGDRATANITRRKLWAIMGEDSAPDITDPEWETMQGSTETQQPAGATGAE